MDRNAMREIGKWLTVSESARRIGISRQGLYPYLYDGRVRAVETQAGWLVDPDAVERMAQEREGDVRAASRSPRKGE